ncbi:ribonuclease H [Senna tora]|uniref:Ribonuclease H n=1 Tax=Senna tora TaxID=362788 RepID=A0A834W9F5_9FABA|nr:ribonuclease H [Senna tora]
MQEYGSEFREGVPNDFVMGDIDGESRQPLHFVPYEPPHPGDGDDSIEDNEDDAIEYDAMEGSDSEDEALGTFVHCTIQREEDLRQINEVVELGAGNKSFSNSFNMYVQSNRPNLVALLETKCNKNKAQSIFEIVGMCKFFCQEGRGFAGGIWVGWTEDFGEVEVIRSDMQYVHLRVKESTQAWILTIIYASPQSETTHTLWQELKRSSENLQVDWALIGDFNDILGASKKKVEPPSILEELSNLRNESMPAILWIFQ